MADARTLNLHKFESTETADQYTGGKGEVVAVFPEDGSDPSLRIHDGTTKGGWEISCGCEGCSDACKKYIDDKVKYFIPGNLSPVIGICLVKEGGGAGTWARVDGDGQPFEVPPYYFDYHPTYSAIKRVTIDGQVMQEHHKFYYKAFTIESGPYVGKPARCISPYKVDDTWKVFPSFMKNGKEIDTWWCGTYQASTDAGQLTADKGENTVLGSAPDKYPFAYVESDIMALQYCRNRNTELSAGWDLWNVYQLAEIQTLALIEAGTSDSQTFYGHGYSNSSYTSPQKVDNTTVAQATWRGHVGLWGNIWQACTGLGYYRENSTLKIKIWKNDGTQEFIKTGIAAPNVSNVAYGDRIKSIDTRKGDGWDFNEIFLTSAVVLESNASQATIPDNFYVSDEGLFDDLSIVNHGGTYTGGERPGLFTMSLPGLVNVPARKNFSARISKTPDPD